MSKATRGRPAGQITPQRAAVRDCIASYQSRGHMVSLSRIAREVGLHSNSDVRRIVGDLKMIGAI